MKEYSVLSPDVVCIDNGTKGIVHLSPDPLQLQQGSYGQDKGFSLAMYRVADVTKVLFYLPCPMILE